MSKISIFLFNIKVMAEPASNGMQRHEQLKNYYEHLISVIEQAENSDERPRISISKSHNMQEIYFSHNGFGEVFRLEKIGPNFILTPFDEGTDYAHGHYLRDTHFRHTITEGQFYDLMKRIEKLRKYT
jgi:hypothetical protein